MRRRKFIGLIGSVAAVPLLWVQVARAQEPGRVYRLGMITGAARQTPRVVAFFDELKGLGFVEGQNLKIVAGGFNLRDDQLSGSRGDVGQVRPGCYLLRQPFGGARKYVNDTHRSHRRRVRRYGCFGFCAFASPSWWQYHRRQFSLILNSMASGKKSSWEAVPGARRIAVLAELNNTQPAELQALQNAARARNLEIAVFTVGAPEQIAPAMDQANAWGAKALNVLAAPLFSFNRQIVIERATALGLPAIYEWPEMAEEAGLIGYGPRLTLIYRQLARLIVMLLRGVKPADIPVEQPTKFELRFVNLKTAKFLG